MATIYEVIQFDHECPPSLAYFTSREAAEEFIDLMTTRFASDELKEANNARIEANDKWVATFDAGEDEIAYEHYNKATARYYDLVAELSGGLTNLNDPTDHALSIVEHELYFSLMEWGDSKY